jgi:hypothetical protein
MNNRTALIKAREIIEVNLKSSQTPARADVGQLIEGYPMQHAITVLNSLIETFRFEDELTGATDE